MLDGRTLEYSALGDLDGFPVIYFHGSPGVAYTYINARELASKGILLLGITRYGWGYSDMRAETTVADVVEDTVSVCRRFGVLDDRDTRQVGVVAKSGGAIYGLAVTEAFTARIRQLVLLGGAPRMKDFITTQMTEHNAEKHSLSLEEHTAKVEGITELVRSQDRRALLDDILRSVRKSDMRFHRVETFGGRMIAKHMAAISLTHLNALESATAAEAWTEELFRSRACPNFEHLGEVPTFVIHGLHDSLVPADNADVMCRYAKRNTQLRVNTGHFGMTLVLPAVLELVGSDAPFNLDTWQLMLMSKGLSSSVGTIQSDGRFAELRDKDYSIRLRHDFRQSLPADQNNLNPLKTYLDVDRMAIEKDLACGLNGPTRRYGSGAHL